MKKSKRGRFMFDTEAVSEILGAEKEGRRVFCVRLSYLAYKKLKSVRKILNDGRDFSEYGREGENLYLWLKENFPRLEDALKNSINSLLHMGKLRGSGRYPLFYKAIYGICPSLGKADEKTLDDVLCMFGENMKNPDFKTGKSLMLLFSCAVCIRLCECFEGAASGEGEIPGLLEDTENLFYTLDSLSAFDEDRILKGNPVEKKLCEDSLYARLTPETRASYRRNLSFLARKNKDSELCLAEKIVAECSETEGRHIGEFLCDKPQGGRTYLTLLFFLSALFTLLLCLISPVFLVSAVIVYGCTKLLLDRIYSRLFRKDYVLPCVRINEIPDGHGVIVVITSLLTGGKADKNLFLKLEEMYFSNGGKNVYFGLLCDLCDSGSKTDTGDEKTIENAENEILKLRKKYGGCFFLFLREREYSESEMAYIAPERKRGAVCALTEFLCRRHDGFSHRSIKPSEDICRNVKYVFTLDADTNLAFDCLNRMTGIMLHPQNKPKTDEEALAIVRGYGILQPAMNPTLSAWSKNLFTAVMCGHGGVDGYGRHGTDMAMKLFGQSIFCGKGMFDKDAFYGVLCGNNAFEKETVLSHDAPEGARLRCAFVPDVVLTDCFPSEELSYYKRLHRWIRGDIQNIRFLLPRVKTEDGGKIKNGISYAGKFLILNNVYSALKAPFSLAMIIIAALSEGADSVLLVTVAMSVYMLPFVYSVLSLARKRIWKNMRRRFYASGIYTGIWTELMRMVLCVGAMVKTACVSADAVVRSTYRSIVSRRNMLEWTTAAQSDAEKKDGLLGYVKKNLVSAIAGAFVFISAHNGFIRLLGLMWFFMPVIAYHSAAERRSVPAFTDTVQKERIRKYCKDMWKYFSENVNEGTNFLPPDNISEHSGTKISRMTSPTNAGLYLLSVLCARELGFIDSREAEKRLSDTLTTVNRLETCGGLLYNWYDIFNASPMPDRYVSAVDIGNFAACLICVKEGVQEYKDSMPGYAEICNMISDILKKNNLSKLYDRERGLFFIGGKGDGKKVVFDRNRYDMLMSEARILSFTAVAQRLVPSEHYKNLSRTFVEGRGYMGLSSWSGTAFEYFMPEIFMPSPKGTLVFEALSFALSNMVRRGAKAGNVYVFGVSESCYNEKDAAGNYKYRAFGIGELSLDISEKQNVFSPYSSFLCLPFAPKTAYSNLESLRCLGAYGRYGFYESVDFERPEPDNAPAVVRCFMAHHIGMSIASCVNLLCGQRVAEWFGRDKHIKSALELTHEMIPYDAYVKSRPRRNLEIYRKNSHSLCTAENTVIFDKICNGFVTVTARRSRFETERRGLCTARRNMFEGGLDGFLFCIDNGKERFVFDNGAKVVSGEGKLGYVGRFCKTLRDETDAFLYVTAGKNTCDTVRISMGVKQTNAEKVTCSVSFYPLLAAKESGSECRFFSDSDISAQVFDGKEVCFKRLSENELVYCGTVTGDNAFAVYEDERITLGAEAVLKNGFLTSEFALCFSNSRRCAEIGFVRCSEKDFEDVCRECGNGAADSRNVCRNVRKGTADGCKTMKKSENFTFPLDSKEKPFLLYASERICFLIRKGTAGVTFSEDINKRRLTAFSGVKEVPCTGERIVFDNDFDLLENASVSSFLPHAAFFDGEYRGCPYRVTCFVCSDMPCKIISISTVSDSDISFEAVPQTAWHKPMTVGSGLAFFGLPSEEKETGFVLGLCRKEDGGVFGAEYETDGSITASFGKRSFGGKKEYVFCVGCETSGKAYEIQKTVMEKNIDVLVEKAKAQTQRMTVDYERMPKDIKQTLGEYFVFPENGVCSRIFVRTDLHFLMFDAILLLYTDFGISDRILKKVLSSEPADTLSRLLFCLFVSEYFGENEGLGFPERVKDGEELYRRCLSYLFDVSRNCEMQSLSCLCLERFACLCDKSGDVRTGGELRAKIAVIEGGNQKGIFL